MFCRADFTPVFMFDCFDCLLDLVLDWVDLVVLEIPLVPQIDELLCWFFHGLIFVDLNAQTGEELY